MPFITSSIRLSFAIEMVILILECDGGCTR